MGLFSEAELFGMTIRESATDGSDFTNPAADYRRLFLGEDGLLHLKDSAGAVTTPGGTPAAGALLAQKIWNGPAVILTTPTSNTDFDATNAAVTFTAPASGVVDIQVFAGVSSTVATQDTYIVVRDGSTEKGARYFSHPAAQYFALAVCYHITGLTPTTSYTYKLGARISAGNIRLEVSAGAGPLIMRVLSGI